jgi:hypothetical protein
LTLCNLAEEINLTSVTSSDSYKEINCSVAAANTSSFSSLAQSPLYSPFTCLALADQEHIPSSMADFEDGNGSARFDGTFECNVSSFMPILYHTFYLNCRLTLLDERTFDRRDRSASPRGERDERNRSRSPRDRP